MGKKLFYVLLGGIVFTCISVLATIIISSGDVEYDNSESGISSTNVEGALDELYHLYVPQSQYDTDLATAQATCPSDVCITTEQYNTLEALSNSSQLDCSGAVNRKQVGDIVTLQATKNGVTTNEEFYVIDSNECVTTLITRYNLYVGYSCTSNSSCSQISPSTSGYGVQSSSARGYMGSYTPGTLDFSDLVYWYENSTLKAKYAVNGASVSGNPYPYVYDSNSNLYQYVVAYKGYLGGIVKIARLATYEEMNNLGCTTSSDSCPSWIRYTNFWTGSASDDSNMWVINGYYGQLNSFSFSIHYDRGVRPVIVISTSDIPS